MIYEDGAVRARLLEEAATVGHVEVVPRREAPTLADLDEGVAEQLFFCASFAATGLFETLGAHGTNIVVEEGERVRASVYARTQSDGLGLRWQPEQADRDALAATADKVREAFWYVGKESADEQPRPAVPASSAEESAPAPAQDYRVQQLYRSP